MSGKPTDMVNVQSHVRSWGCTVTISVGFHWPHAKSRSTIKSRFRVRPTELVSIGVVEGNALCNDAFNDTNTKIFFFYQILYINMSCKVSPFRAHFRTPQFLYILFNGIVYFTFSNIFIFSIFFSEITWVTVHEKITPPLKSLFKDVKIITIYITITDIYCM